MEQGHPQAREKTPEAGGSPGHAEEGGTSWVTIAQGPAGGRPGLRSPAGCRGCAPPAQAGELGVRGREGLCRGSGRGTGSPRSSQHHHPSLAPRPPPASDPAGVAFEGRRVRFMARPLPAARSRPCACKGDRAAEGLRPLPWKHGRPGAGQGGEVCERAGWPGGLRTLPLRPAHSCAFRPGLHPPLPQAHPRPECNSPGLQKAFGPGPSLGPASTC